MIRRPFSAEVDVSDLLPPAWHATAPPSPRGETHENCPRNALRASRRNARVAVSVVGHEEWVVDDVSCRGHHEVRTVVPGRGQADEGPDTGRGGVRDRLVPGQRPASADQRGAEPAGGWTLGHDAATQAAGDQVLL